MYKEIYRKLQKDILENPFVMGTNPSNFDYGLGYFILLTIYMFYVITSPVWWPIWFFLTMIGKLIKRKLK